MTGVVLALAGLTCGDDGQSEGAVRAPVEIGGGQTWEGLVDGPPPLGVYCVEVDFKRGYWRALPGGRPEPFRVTLLGGQDVRVRWRGQERLGTLSFDRGVLSLVVSEKPGTRPRGFEPACYFALVPAAHARPPAPKRPGGYGAIPGLPGMGGFGLPGRGFPGGGFGRSAPPRKP